MVLKVTTEMVSRSVDAVLVARVGKDENIFKGCKKINTLKENLQQAEKKLREQQQAHILEAFRENIAAFLLKYGEMPTRILMNYSDISHLCDAYNDERVEQNIDRERVSSYGEKIYIDGIHVKQGCDQEPGDIRIFNKTSD